MATPRPHCLPFPGAHLPPLKWFLGAPSVSSPEHSPQHESHDHTWHRIPSAPLVDGPSTPSLDFTAWSPQVLAQCWTRAQQIPTSPLSRGGASVTAFGSISGRRRRGRVLTPSARTCKTAPARAQTPTPSLLYVLVHRLADPY